MPAPPSWGISVDRPLISGRKQGPVTRSGGWGEYPGLWVKGDGGREEKEEKEELSGIQTQD